MAVIQKVHLNSAKNVQGNYLDANPAKKTNQEAKYIFNVISARMAYICSGIKPSHQFSLIISLSAYQTICLPENLSVGMVNALDPSRKLYASTFKQCQTCQNTKQCKRCDSNDPSKCLECRDSFLDADQKCVSYPPNLNLDNCMQATATNNMTCSVCNDGYFVNSGGSCTSCKISNCLECSNSSYCNVCASGYSLYLDPVSGKQTCYDCNFDQSTQTTSYFPDCESCSVDLISNTIQTKCLSCRNGFLSDDLVSPKCQVNCPIGKYGDKTFGPRGRPTATICSDCDASCEMCVGSGSEKCSSCPSGSYLSLASNQISYGTCIVKDPSLREKTVELFVSYKDELSIIYDSQGAITSLDQLDGSYQKPMIDIYDAFQKGYELCAEVVQTCKVTIYLLRGDHYMLNTERAYYRPLKQDILSQNIMITIKPLFCNATFQTDCITEDYKLTIVNKRKEKFNFLVGQGLTLQNIILDSIDSIIPVEKDVYNCLKVRFRCCWVDFYNNIAENPYSPVKFGCQLYQKPTEKCHLTASSNIIVFNKSPRSVLTEPPKLIIKNVEFYNIFFEFNSIIGLNSFGGHVEISNSKFQRISSCGALIKNTMSVYNPGYDDLDELKEQQLYQRRNNYLQYEVQSQFDQLQNKAQNFSTCSLDFSDNLPDCFSITISDCIFQDFGYQTSISTSSLTVNSQYGMSHQGRILNLDNFQGDVVVKSSTFQNNFLYLESCYVNEVTVVFYKNTFYQNTGLNSLVYVDVTEDQWKTNQKPILFHFNNFINNAAYYHTNTIQIISRSSLNLFYLPDIDNLELSQQTQCGGIQISNNYFNKNFGCRYIGGSLYSIKCLYPGEAPLFKETYSIDYPLDFQQSNYAINYTLFEKYTNNLTIEIADNEVVDLNKVVIKNNVLIENFGGFREGLVSFIAIDRILIQNDTYINNGETTVEIVATLGLINGYIPFIQHKNGYNLEVELKAGRYIDMSLVVNSETEQSIWIEGQDKSQDLLRSMIYVTHCRYIKLKDIFSKENYLYEMKTQDKRATFLFLAFFYGDMIFNNVTFLDYTGSRNNFTKSRGWIRLNASNYDNFYGQPIPMVTCYEDYYSKSEPTACNIQSLTISKMNITNLQQQISATVKQSTYPNQALFFQTSSFSIPMKQAIFDQIYVNIHDCVYCEGRTMFYAQTYDVRISNVEINNFNQKYYKFTLQKYGEVIDFSGKNRVFTIVMRKNDTYNSKELIPLAKDCYINNMIGMNGTFLNIDGFQSEKVDFNFTIQNITMKNSFSLSGSNLLHMADFDNSTLDLNQLNISNVTGLEKGVLIMIVSTKLDSVQAIGNITLRNSTISDTVYEQIASTNSQQGWGIHVYQNASFKFNSTNNTIDCGPNYGPFLTPKYDWKIFQEFTGFIQGLYSQNIDFGSFFYLNGSQKGNITVISENNKYTHCINCYRENIGGKGGSIYCKNCLSINITDTLFSENTAYQGGALALEYFQNFNKTVDLLIANFTIQECHTINDAGFLYFESADCPLNLTIYNITANNISSSLIASSFIFRQNESFGGGFAKILGTNVSISVNKTNFTNVLSMTQNGGVFLIKGNNIRGSIDNSILLNISALENGGMIYGISEKIMDFNMTSLTTNCTTYIDLSTVLKVRDDLVNSNTQIGSVIFLQSGVKSTINSNKNKFSNCFMSGSGDKGGGIYHLGSQISLVEQFAKMEMVGALQGGIYYCDSCNLEISFTEFDDIFCREGCIVYATSGSQIDIQNTIMQNITAILSGGVIFYSFTNDDKQIYDNVTCNNCTFSEIQAYQRSPIMTISDYMVSITISSCNFNGIVLQEENNPFKCSAGFDLLYPMTKFTMTDSSINFDRLPDNQNLIQKVTFNVYTFIYTYRELSEIFIQGNTFTSSRIFDEALGLKFLQLDSVISSGDIFKAGSAEMLSMMYIEKAANVTFSGNQIQDTLIYQTGVIQLLNVDNATIYWNTFNRSAAIQGGAFYISASTATMKFNTFENCYAQTAGVLSMVDDANISVESSTFKNILTSLGGGIIASIRQKSTLIKQPILNIKNCTFRDITVVIQGGILYLSNFEIWVSVNDSTFDNIQSAYQQGGLIYSSEAAKISINNITVKLAKSGSEGKIFFNTGNIDYVQITNSNFQCESPESYDPDKLISIIDQDKSGQSAFFFSNIGQIRFKQNKVMYCNRALSGGVFYIQNSKFSDDSSTYMTSEGGVGIIDRTNLTGQKLYILNNYAKLKGGGLVMQTKSQMYIKIKSNIYNKIKQKHQFIQGDETVIEDTQFILNSAYSVTIFAIVKSDEIELNNTSIKGSFIQILMNVNLTVENTQFLNGKAENGGAIYISGDSNITFINSLFQNNKAKDSGGAIYASSFQSLIIKDNCRFLNNYAFLSAGDVLGEQNIKEFIFQDSIIQNEVSAMSIKLQSVYFLARNLTIKRGNANVMNSDFGGTIYCQDCFKFHLNDSIITGSRAKYAGSIYLIETEVRKEQEEKADVRYKMFNTQILNSVAYEDDGGSIMLDNVMNMQIGNLTILNSYAASNGGAIYSKCDAPNYNCLLKFTGTSRFQNNEADLSGGAIFWRDVEPKYQTLSAQFYFQNNSAGIYGDNIGSYSQKLIMISEVEYRAQLYRVTGDQQYTDQGSERILQVSANQNVSTQVSQSNTRSGDTLPKTYIALADKYNQIVGTADQAKLQISVVEKSNNTLYKPLVEGQTSFYSEKGMFKVNDLQFTGTPGKDYQLVFNTQDGIDKTKPSNKEYLETVLKNEEEISFKFEINLRECAVGEQFTDSGKCNECPSGSSFSLVKMDSPGQCQSCPTSQALCNGGNNVGPQPGYWRKSNKTYVFVKCFNENACLGMIPPENNPQGSCRESYFGILCSDCETGYSRTGNFECSPCPDKTQNVLRIIAIIIAMIAVIVFLIRSTLNGAAETKNVTSVFQKILLNHIQLLMVTASFDFDWPKILISFFQTSQNVGAASEQVFSVDCFLVNDKKNSIMSPFYISFWGIQAKRLKDIKIMKVKGISTLVILLFLVHPNIVQYVFKTFNCVTVDDDTRMKEDLSEICYQGSHFFWSIGIALPSLITWGLGIPLFAFILLTRERKVLEKLETRQKYGFLFRGYRLRFYYWEVVIMYRKISLIFISAFLVKYGVITQALIVFVLLIVFLVINVKKSPFQTVPLNQLETLSLVTSMISVFCGMFFIVDVQQTDANSSGTQSSSYGGKFYNLNSLNIIVSLDNSTVVLFFVVILLSNIIFFSYWIVKFFDEIKQMLIKKFKLIYIFVCLCGDKQKFIKLEKEAIIFEINEGLREKYIDTLKTLKKIYNDGDLVLNEKNVEKIQMYLSKEKIFKIAGIDFDKRTQDEKEHDQKRLDRKQKAKKMNLDFENEKQMQETHKNSQDTMLHKKRGKVKRGLIKDDEILDSIKDKDNIDDYIENQERECNNPTQQDYQRLSYQSPLRQSPNGRYIDRENLLNLESQTHNGETFFLTQSEMGSLNSNRKMQKPINKSENFHSDFLKPPQKLSSQKLVQIQSQKRPSIIYNNNDQKTGQHEQYSNNDLMNQSSFEDDEIEEYVKQNSKQTQKQSNKQTFRIVNKIEEFIQQKISQGDFQKQDQQIQIMPKIKKNTQQVKKLEDIKEEIKEQNSQKYKKLRTISKNNFITPNTNFDKKENDLNYSQGSNRDINSTQGKEDSEDGNNEELLINIDFDLNDTAKNKINIKTKKQDFKANSKSQEFLKDSHHREKQGTLEIIEDELNQKDYKPAPQYNTQSSRMRADSISNSSLLRMSDEEIFKNQEMSHDEKIQKNHKTFLITGKQFYQEEEQMIEGQSLENLQDLIKKSKKKRDRNNKLADKLSRHEDIQF
eukprot:403346168